MGFIKVGFRLDVVKSELILIFLSIDTIIYFRKTDAVFARIGLNTYNYTFVSRVR